MDKNTLQNPVFRDILPAVPREAQKGACCGPGATPASSHYAKPGYSVMNFVDCFIDTPAGPVPKVKTTLDAKDMFSALMVRIGFGRNHYTVAPGLYAIGDPDEQSVVFATANFKLSFDHLRKELSGINAWILVLDTRGINVWCAAGKGTFSTGELVNRIVSSSLETVVAHRRIILPQLGATGVSAGDVKKRSGFRVIYGPVRASDIPVFLKNKRKADKQMRLVTFNTYERFILTPVEIHMALKPALVAALVLVLVSGIGPDIFSFSSAWERGIAAVMALLAGIASGAFITPLVLPWVPFKAFAAKGIMVGTVTAVLPALIMSPAAHGLAEGLALFLFSVVVSSYLAMNFTGATPFTSPSGVEKEMKQFLPVQMGGLACSSTLWIYAAF